MQFMLRVNLTGQEVPAFNECMTELEVELRKSENNGGKDGSGE